MLRHLFKTGNSIVISLPQEVLDSVGLAEGESVFIEVDRERKRIILSAEKPLAMAGVDQSFARQVDGFIGRYRPALEELAR